MQIDKSMKNNEENKDCDDIILYNGKIFHEGGICSALAIGDMKIIRLGDTGDVMPLKKPTSKLIDLKGKTAIPGIIDSHTHFIQSALSELDGEVYIPQSVGELLEYIKVRVKIFDRGQWLHFRYTYPTRLSECRFPSLDELDGVAPDHPVFIDAAYAAQVNTYALKTAGMDENTIPPSGKLVRDKNSGKLTGLLLLCSQMIRQHIKQPEFTREQTVRAIDLLQKHYNRLGITSIIEGGSTVKGIEAYNSLYESGKLQLRVVYTCWPANIEDIEANIDALKAAVNTPASWGKLNFLKTAIDGGILTGTSYMRKPFKDCGVFGIDDPSFRGCIFKNEDQLVEFIRKACGSGLQMTAHCVGDAAADMFISAYSRIDNISRIKGMRHGITHADFTDIAMLKKISDMGLLLVSQPAWHYKDGSVLEKVLDRDTMKTFLPYRDIIDRGIKVSAGSDHMIKHDSFLSQNPYNPFLGMYSMITRKDRKGEKIQPDQAVSREEALMAYTINGAYATFDENYKGSLKEGKFADLAVLSEDYFTCPLDEIPDIESVLTIVNGKIVYEV